MKKIYAILVAAVMSVSLFADPTQADLQSYMEDGYYVACFQAPAATTCKDIYWVGEYGEGWTVNSDLENYVKCEALTGANAGWYVAKVPADKGTNGKPIQLNECGKLTWDVQPGPVDGKPTELVAGAVTIQENGAEYNLEGWSTTEPTIIKIGAWKNDYDPCTKQCAQQSYTIRIYPPFCEYLDDLEPTVMGSINNWAGALTMEFKGSYFELVTEPVSDNFEFKFNNDPNGKWDHEFQVYDAENDTWGNVPASGNFSLTNGTEFYTYDQANRILTFDFSDDTKYQYKGCEEQEPEDPTVYYTCVGVKVPAGAPEAGVEIIGSFGDDAWNTGAAMELLNTGWWFVELEVKGSDEFKFREKGTWANEIVYVEKISDKGEAVGLENFRFDKNWKDDSWKGVDCKWVELDLSDAKTYVWKTDWVAPAGVEDIVLTVEAKKVMVDGVLYIVRDNKLFNVQGAQVR